MDERSGRSFYVVWMGSRTTVRNRAANDEARLGVIRERFYRDPMIEELVRLKV